jgi:hypothetical protein
MTVGDGVLLALLAGGIGALAAALWQPRMAATQAELRLRGQLLETIPLQQARVVEVEGALGASRLEVQPGRIRFVDGPCRNRVCIHSGWLRYSGEGTACLPNRLSLSLSGGDGADAFSF